MPLPDLPPFSDTAAAFIRLPLAGRRLCDLGLDRTGLLEAGRLRRAAAALLTVENSYRAELRRETPTIRKIGMRFDISSSISRRTAAALLAPLLTLPPNVARADVKEEIRKAASVRSRSIVR